MVLNKKENLLINVEEYIKVHAERLRNFVEHKSPQSAACESEALTISVCDLLNELPELYVYFCTDFPALQSLFERALKCIYKKDQSYKGVQSRPFIRFCGLLNEISYALPSVTDVGTFLTVVGTVVKVSDRKMLEHSKEYSCKRCAFRQKVQVNFAQYCSISTPNRCSNPEGCGSVSLKPVNGSSECKDYQEIKIQEKVGCVGLVSMRRPVCVLLEDDLVDTVLPGDDILVNGEVIQRWSSLSVQERPVVDLAIHANYITVLSDNCKGQSEVSEEQRRNFELFWRDHKEAQFLGRNKIIQSICPNLHGLFLAKLSVALVLIGGVAGNEESGSKLRGDSHLLLIGDPSTGKSELLRAASRIAGRSVLTTGVGSTNAGLTCAAVKESGGWHLEAGALVLADGGICCVDEFGCMSEKERECVLEAMEQQTVSTAKAGLIATLNTRCAVLATLNPKGSYDRSLDIATNTGLSSPLLSRFDLILILLDHCDVLFDSEVSEMVLSPHRSLVTHHGSVEVEVLWTEDELRAYFLMVKALKPEMSTGASSVLKTYYQRRRSQIDNLSSGTTTVRLLESLVRLSQAHARLMLRETVLVADAVFAVALVEYHVSDSLITGINCAREKFPVDAETHMIELGDRVLRYLNLERYCDELHSSFSVQFMKLQSHEENDEDDFLRFVCQPMSAESSDCVAVVNKPITDSNVVSCNAQISINNSNGGSLTCCTARSSADSNCEGDLFGGSYDDANVINAKFRQNKIDLVDQYMHPERTVRQRCKTIFSQKRKIHEDVEESPWQILRTSS